MQIKAIDKFKPNIQMKNEEIYHKYKHTVLCLRVLNSEVF